MSSRRRFIKTATLAGSAGLSVGFNPLFGNFLQNQIHPFGTDNKHNINNTEPIGHFSGVSVNNLLDIPFRNNKEAIPSPMLDKFKDKHPRMFINSSDLETFKNRLNNPVVKRFYKPAEILERKAPAFKPGTRNGGPYRYLASYALSFLLEPDDRKLKPILEWLETATTYPHCEVDLDAEYFMEGVALTYDWLYDFIPDELKVRLRDTIARQCREVYEASLINRAGGRLHFQQNHYWYSHFSLALGAAAIYNELPETKEWLQWAWDRYERIALSFSPDGSFHEGPGYWDFSMPVLYMYTDLYEMLSGVNVSYANEGFKGQAEFRFHHLYPGLEFTASIEDTGAHKKRPHEKLILWEAKRFQDPVTMGMAELINREPDWNCCNLLWLDENLKGSDPLHSLPTAKYYQDIETVFARTGWNDDASFAAFVSRPLGGHKYAEICSKFGVGGLGHNHPGQNHFIIFGNGEVLAADPGYTYEKKTRNHNTVLIDGKEQYGDGEKWPAPNPGRAHITHFATEEDITIVTGNATSAYPKDLGLKLFERTLVLAGKNLVVVFDRLKSEKPVTFSWLLHHYGNITAKNEKSWTITRNNAQLDLNVLQPQKFRAETTTYRPQYSEPSRDLTPKEADINMLELKVGPSTENNFLIPLFVGETGNQIPEIKSFSTKSCEGIRLGNMVIAFNKDFGIMEVPLPWGENIRADAKTIVAKLIDGKSRVVSTPSA